MVLFGSGMSESNNHERTDLPTLLVGGFGGRGSLHVAADARDADRELHAVARSALRCRDGQLRHQHRNRGHLIEARARASATCLRASYADRCWCSPIANGSELADAARAGKRGRRPNIDRVCGGRRAGFAGPRRHDAALVGSADQRPRDRAHAAQRRRRRESRQPLRHHAVCGSRQRTAARRSLPCCSSTGPRRAAGLPHGETPLMAAARSGDAESIQLLLDAGADPNVAETSLGETALMWAAAEDHADAIRVLVAGGADPSLASRVLDLAPMNWLNIGMVSTVLPVGGWPPLLFAGRENATGCCARAHRSRRRSRYPRSRRIDRAERGDHERALRSRRCAARGRRRPGCRGPARA